MRGAVLMQTQRFRHAANVLASLAVPYQIPLIMFVSERGTLGEFNYGQALVCRTMRPVLDSLAMEHHTSPGSTNSNSSSIARSSRPSPRRRRWR